MGEYVEDVVGEVFPKRVEVKSRIEVKLRIEAEMNVEREKAGKAE